MYEPMPYYDQCSLLLPMSGENNGTTFGDYSKRPKRVSVNGSAKTVLSPSKYYGSSVYFANSVSNYLSIPFSDDFNFGTGEFTIAAWIYVLGAPGSPGEFFQIFQAGQRNTGSGKGGYSFRLGSQSLIAFELIKIGSSINTVASIPALSLNAWHHVAVVRTSDSVNFFVDGVKYLSNNSLSSENINNFSSLSEYIGVSGSPNYWYSNGYIQDLIVLKGKALWTADFTPPTQLIETVSSALLAVNAFNLYSYSITLSITESLVATDFIAVVTSANTGFILSKTTVSSASPTIHLSTNDPVFVTLYPNYEATWEASKDYALGAKCFPTDPVLTPYYFECTTSGISDVTEPTWDTGIGNTTTDNAATWTCVERMVQPVTHGPLTPQSF